MWSIVGCGRRIAIKLENSLGFGIADKIVSPEKAEEGPDFFRIRRTTFVGSIKNGEGQIIWLKNPPNW